MTFEDWFDTEIGDSELLTRALCRAAWEAGSRNYEELLMERLDEQNEKLAEAYQEIDMLRNRLYMKGKVL